MSRTRTFLSALVLLGGLALLAPAHAQVMPTQGLDLPWFHSSQERAQREACRRNLPECRAAVRTQMEIEESITVVLPWAALGIAILVVLFYLRAQEKKREQQKKRARLNHNPGAFKKLDKEKKARDDDADEEESDRMSS